MKKKFTHIFSAIIISLSLATALYAADATFTASLRILTALGINATALTFPDVAVDEAAALNSITVAPTDPGASTLTITGEPNGTVTVSVADFSMTDGANSIPVNTFTFSTGSGDNTLNGTGDLTLTIGATADLSGNPPIGNYTNNAATATVIYR